MDTYTELLQKYNAALNTIIDLQTENRQLKARLGISEIAPTANDETEKPTINKYSSTDEKIALFRKLFCGREDVFARRWYSKTTGKSGYQPVCENEWVEGLCDRHISVPLVRTENFCRLPITQSIIILQEKTNTAGMSSAFIQCSTVTPAVFYVLILMMRIMKRMFLHTKRCAKNCKFRLQ